MKSVSDLIIRVCDHGLFVPVARRLARDAKHVSYYSPCEDGFPTMAKCVIGDGFTDIERVDSIWTAKKDVDLFVFPDIGFADEQAELIAQGYPVWGHHGADELEIHRGLFLDTIKQVGLPVPKYATVEGMTALVKHLKPVKDKWVKVSRYRGDVETFHWRDWEQDEATLDYYAAKLGQAKDSMMFYVLDPIPTEIEDGVDTWCVDGQFPGQVIHGMECKDKAYLGTRADVDDLPEQLTEVNEKFGPLLAGYGYRSFFSTEVRITKEGKPYFIDPTLRAGSPPSQVQTELIKNYAEVIWGGANGECVDPVFAAKFGLQTLLSTDRDHQTWCGVAMPPGLDQWVKSGYSCQIGKRTVFPPVTGPVEVDWLVSTGDTIEEVIATHKNRIKELPDGLTTSMEAVGQLLDEIHAAEDKGMSFTDDIVPDPSIVMEEA